MNQQPLFFGQLVIGPAGSGKSTYCKVIQDMGEILRRNILVVNLDPAAETFQYKCDVDIRELIQTEEVMEELKLGPNGGLVYSMEYLLENIDWLSEKLTDLYQDDYVLFDCPGQIELYTHLELINKLITSLKNIGFNLCSIYMLDVTFLSDDTKFISGALMAMSTMMSLSLPHITVLSKCDLIPNKKLLKKYKKATMDYYTLDTEIDYLAEENLETASSNFELRYRKMTNAIKGILNDHNMVTLMELNLNEEDSIKDLILQADYSIQYGENLEPNDAIYNALEENPE